ncbi:hypothetical protein GOV09_01760 [Candidatus Woesearchaeota archaeon]|nr:hypothetical protein [Candidatus Woesearchaeota archaeon]
MKTIYVFGNEFLAEDSFARKTSEYLNDVHLIHCRSPDDLLEADGEITILDVVKGIEKPIIITDVNQLQTRDIISLHDFDLSFFLTLLQNMGIGKNIKIIGIPMQGDAQKMAQEVEACL